MGRRADVNVRKEPLDERERRRLEDEVGLERDADEEGAE